MKSRKPFQDPDMHIIKGTVVVASLDEALDRIGDAIADYTGRNSDNHIETVARPSYTYSGEIAHYEVDYEVLL